MVTQEFQDRVHAVEPGVDFTKWSHGVGYMTLIQAMGHDLLVHLSESGWSGDDFLLMRDADGRYGFLVFGWGSCSGCDAMEAASSWEDAEAIYQKLCDDVHWFDTLAGCVAYIHDKHRAGMEWYRFSDEFPSFVQQVDEYVASQEAHHDQETKEESV